jgi:putative sigma-54 modulation protein
MHIDITGRHMDITPALKDFTHDKLSKLERLLDGPIDIKVVLAIEKHRHTAEIQVKSRAATFSGTQVTGDLYASIGDVVDKLERQVLKHKEKRQDHKHRKSQRDPEVAAAIETIVVEQMGTEPVAADNNPSEPNSPRIFRSVNYRVKPLTAEDAVLELEGTGENIIVFRDTVSNRPCVLYRQQEGEYGLIEPEW